jgi:hypothetical protein
MKLIIGIVITAWLVLGIAASLQRGYLSNDQAVSCKTGADTGLTILSGPLNYVGVNPKIHCKVKAPRPSV